jgi:hypothetical protein
LKHVVTIVFFSKLTLDSPALLELGHGTIRYRLPDEKTLEQDNKVKTGYFYHPRLDDYSEGKCRIVIMTMCNIINTEI